MRRSLIACTMLVLAIVLASASDASPKSSSAGSSATSTNAPEADARPYDETADAHADIIAARDEAAAQDKRLLLVFGANWCPDCRVLASAMARAPLADEIDTRYVVVKVDVGNWNKNLDVVQSWGNPIAKGIPAIVVAQPHGAILYATRAGELANARRMGNDAFAKFFAGLPAEPGASSAHVE